MPSTVADVYWSPTATLMAASFLATWAAVMMRSSPTRKPVPTPPPLHNVTATRATPELTIRNVSDQPFGVGVAVGLGLPVGVTLGVVGVGSCWDGGSAEGAGVPGAAWGGRQAVANSRTATDGARRENR